jgi:sec-independent protein translocase protein TatB
MSSLGMADSLILMVLALVVFGPRKLPQIGRQIGKLMYEFRKASNDFKFQMEEELRMAEDAERKQKEEAQRQQALTGQAAVSAPVVTQTLEDPTVEKMPDVTPPRLSIQPPSTGEVVTANKPDAPKPDVPKVDVAEPAVEAHIGAEEPAQASSQVSSEASPAGETVSQHG